MTARWKFLEGLETYFNQHRGLRWLAESVVILLVFGVAGLLVAASGIVPIKASAGHLPITEWFLQFAKQRSVSTHASLISIPPLESQALILKGAGHYEIGCRPCHGSPAQHHPFVPSKMLPPPPYLPDTIHRWESQELFYIVKHGIKMTGMPAWPTSRRDDEIWAMVAFLKVFPKLDVKQYDALVRGKTRADNSAKPATSPPLEAATADILKTCTACHGSDGTGIAGGHFPVLAGQQTDYLVATLEAYARGNRFSGTMETVASRLDHAQMKSVADYFARHRIARTHAASSDSLPAAAAAIERGQKIATKGIPAQEIPACVDCHGAGSGSSNPLYPRLSGQHADYFVEQLQLFKAGQRGGTSSAHLMRPIASGLTPDQMRDVATYFESLAPDEKRQGKTE